MTNLHTKKTVKWAESSLLHQVGSAIGGHMKSFGKARVWKMLLFDCYVFKIRNILKFEYTP